IYPHTIPADPMEARPPLPDPDTMLQGYRRDAESGLVPTAEKARRIVEEYLSHSPPVGPFHVRTALAIEPRDGGLCVFMPPVETLEDYL
ncbi:transglutaminase family protein, partial [Mycobacterium tuberculosis]|nr:transglutaminase family protein [Mycobacterium tuberculosis]